MHTQQEGLTPLMLASQEGHVDVASTLIHHGADVNCQNEVSYILYTVHNLYKYFEAPLPFKSTSAYKGVAWLFPSCPETPPSSQIQCDHSMI